MPGEGKVPTRGTGSLGVRVGAGAGAGAAGGGVHSSQSHGVGGGPSGFAQGLLGLVQVCERESGD